MPRGSVFGEDASRPYYCCYALGCEILTKQKLKYVTLLSNLGLQGVTI